LSTKNGVISGIIGAIDAVDRIIIVGTVVLFVFIGSTMQEEIEKRRLNSDITMSAAHRRHG
jgi:hypothetical protein